MSRLRTLAPWVGLIFGLLVSCLLALFFKENPLHVLRVLCTSFMASKFDLGLTLFYTTCLIFSGLSFAIPMKAGLFHIGSEGQIVISALVMAALGHMLSPFDHVVSFVLTLLLTVVLALASGIVSALLIGFFKIYRQAHEVVVAIMLNFILAALANWAAIQHLQNPDSQNPETALMQPAFRFLQHDFLKLYFDNSAVSSFLLVAVFCCGLLYIIEKRSIIFYRMKAFGQNPAAAERGRISQLRSLGLALALAGLFSALVGLTEVLGNTFQYKLGFSPQYGFLGIAVALLARQNFIGIIGSAFLMACLHKGSSDLDLETEYLTRDFSRVLQAIIIFSVAASYSLFSEKRTFFKEKKGGHADG